MLKEVRVVKFFSVCTDEAADYSNKEQLPLVIRFVDAVDSIRKVFVDFVFCNTGTTGSAIADTSLGTLAAYGLNTCFIRGRGYDGAGNMAGKYRGAASIIQSQFPKVVYVHCAAYAMNLCVVAACSVQLVKNMMSTLTTLCIFLHTHQNDRRNYRKQFNLAIVQQREYW